MVDDMEGWSDDCQAPAPLPRQQAVEGSVQHENSDQARGGQPRLPSGDGCDQEHARKDARSMTPAEVERCRTRALLEQQLYPRRATAKEVRSHHAAEGPSFQVLSLDARIQDDPRAVCRQPHPELDVLHRRLGESVLVEAAGAEEGLTPDGTEPGPEGRGRSGTSLMHVVVQQVPEVGDQA